MVIVKAKQISERLLFDSRIIIMALRLFAVGLAAVHTWAAITAHSMNADGINYLDMGDAYWRGDWATAVNPVWSPMYAWVLGLVMRIIQPAMSWEFTLVHLVNFAIFIFTLICFEQFWRRLRHSHPEMAWPEWAWWSLGYMLFVWATLNLIEIWSVTPDMLMAAFVLLAATLFLKIRAGDTQWRTFILFGLVLGLGYLAKAIMLPVSVIFLLVGGLIAKRRSTIFLSTAVFLLLVLPYIALISSARGHVTWGDAGTITYVRYVNGLPYPHWQGGPPENGYPLHPTRQIFDTPPIYEFGGPIGGTYPVSYDPVYWYEGVQTAFNWPEQIRALLTSALFYFDTFLRQLGVWLALVGLLFGMGKWNLALRDWRSIPQQWGLAIPAVAAFGAYALVYVEGRYVAVFVILLMGELLAKVRGGGRTAVTLAAAIMSLFMFLQIIAFNLAGAGDLAANRAPTATAAPGSTWPGEIAETLRQLGIQSGDKVGIIGYAFEAFWPRLARVQVVAEMLEWEAQPFWLGDVTLQQQVIEAFASTGAHAIVAEYVPNTTQLPGWHRVGESSFYIYVIDKP